MMRERRQEIEDRHKRNLEKRAEANARKELKAIMEEKLAKEIEAFGYGLVKQKWKMELNHVLSRKERKQH